MPYFLKPREVGRSYVFSYSQCIADSDGWCDPTYYLPLAYDLVKLKIKRNDKICKKEYSGWWSGVYWEGPYLRIADEIIGWKRMEEEQ